MTTKKAPWVEILTIAAVALIALGLPISSEASVEVAPAAVVREHPLRTELRRLEDARREIQVRFACR